MKSIFISIITLGICLLNLGQSQELDKWDLTKNKMLVITAKTYTIRKWVGNDVSLDNKVDGNAVFHFNPEYINGKMVQMVRIHCLGLDLDFSCEPDRVTYDNVYGTSRIYCNQATIVVASDSYFSITYDIDPDTEYVFGSITVR